MVMMGKRVSPAIRQAVDEAWGVSPTYEYDFDGYLWVTASDGELCGPYDDLSEAQVDFPDQTIVRR